MVSPGGCVIAQLQIGRKLSASSRAVMVLGAVVIAAVLGMTTYEIWRQRAITIASTERNLQALSLAMAEQTEQSFHSADLVVAGTVSAMRAEGMPKKDSIELYRLLNERTIGVPQMVGLAVLDAQGGILATKRAYPPPMVNLSDREYFVHHRDNPDNDLHIGIPGASPVDGKIVVPVSRRISAPDGSFLGVALAVIDPNYFEGIFSRVLPASNGSAFAMFRTDGILLARAPAAKGAVPGQSYAHLADFQPGGPQTGLARGISPMDRTIRIVAFTTLAHYPIKINFSVDESELLAPWRGNAARLTLAAFLATIVLTSAVAVLALQLHREEVQAAQLRESEHRLRFARFALDNAADLVFWLDPDGRVLYANRAAETRLGFQAGQSMRMTVGDFDLGVSPDGWQRQFEQLKREGQLRLESIHRTRDGETYPVEVAINHVSFEGHDYACAFARDITDRHNSEAALAEKTARLEQSNAELEQFAYVASHDLREPLRMVNSFVTMLARRYGEKLDDEAREYIAFAQEGAVRMDRLILDLLEYSRVGRLDRPLTSTPLAQAMDLATKGLALAIQENNAELTIAGDLPPVLANEEELIRLFLNLIGNSLKYHHPDRPPRITFGAERRGDEVLCWVRDNGIGIAPQYFERIFRIFQRLHNRDRYEGTGIGLAICKKIVERHGGRIWVESEPDQGSTFFVTLRAA
jgi:PAS domain S-box-containing protein